MIGSNTIIFNQATMIEIVQYWITNKMMSKDEPSPAVHSVKATNVGMGDDFTVDLRSEPRE